jgi:hypothetical protein
MDAAIEATKAEQFRDKGRVLSSSAQRLHQNLAVSEKSQLIDDEK